ncbi:protein COFACTOR ASSEMBLY OF COMPLEX C SUBUNIT B CCB4, chloroplastic-like isoform X1 [Rhododendron vialii]|uniref:protein COFACTOR ASSEMBLY OF COMPLEX C SUBUNIT B CCB4, chloroplastic-like isoform X1 n=1 Tax=Rhododendron vialii TaxID=182163 RepID=UPI00265EF62F|nr:protein COFACTOR ASSEMBLY OF COMPLEX C SUBUNIT B CCB4, chloroplastic-like isoform X1 [Rhododendron vialii]
MEAGNLLLRRPIVIRIFNPKQPPPPPSLPPRLPSSFPPSFRVSSDLQRGYRGPKPRREWVADWVSRNDDAVRSLPIYVGAVSLLAVLVNRGVSGIAPVANASSSQSRADLLTLGLAVTNILAGLVWLSIRPKTIVAVSPQGVECLRLNSHLPDFVISELIWRSFSYVLHRLLFDNLCTFPRIWESLSAATCCRSLAIVYDSKLILQTGVAASSSANDREAVPIDASTLMQGALYRSVLDSGSQSYLANLSLYPGKSELPFLPPNMQAVILQPLGDKGIAIIGGDTIRGFTTSDQAWISLLGDKLDATLTKCANNLAVAVQDRD